MEGVQENTIISPVKEKDQLDYNREAAQYTNLEDKCKQAPKEEGVIFQAE